MRFNYSVMCKTCAVLIVSLCLCACVASFRNPLSDLREAKPDERLLGKWVTRDEGRAEYVQFDSGLNGEISVSAFGAEEGKPVFKAFTAKLADSHFMTLISTEEGDDGYAIVKYEIKNDTLTVWMLDEEKVKAVVRQGKLSGKVEDGAFGDVIVSASSEKLAAFFKSSDSKQLFTLFGSFEKVKK